MYPYEDPVANRPLDPGPPPMASADPLAGLAQPHEVMAALAFVRDAEALAKARADRLVPPRTPGPAARAGKEEESEEKPPAGRGRRRR